MIVVIRISLTGTRLLGKIADSSLKIGNVQDEPVTFFIKQGSNLIPLRMC